MRPDPSKLDHPGLQNHILKLSKEIEVLKTSLADCITSWKMFGFADVRNPIAESLQHDIDSREASLQRAREDLAKFPANTDLKPMKSASIPSETVR